MADNLAWVISVNMGYGHQRTAYPLKDLAPDKKIIFANDYFSIPQKDKKIWQSSQKSYEAISRAKRIPVIGNFIFKVYDSFQKILSYYPKRDLSRPTLNLMTTYSVIKRGWGRDLIEKLKIQNSKIKKNLPLISTFYVPAFMAEEFDYPGEIFCVVCDADVARHWAPLKPFQSRIKYLAPTRRVVDRLRFYGVKRQNIFFTGYPLPKENLGENLEILKSDLANRLLNLDPQKQYFKKYKPVVDETIGKLPEKSNHLLTIMFSVGGAGAQKELGFKIFQGLSPQIKQGKLKLILSAGIKNGIKEYFEKKISREYFSKSPSSGGVEILYQEKIDNYFKEFNEKLRKTDILWTKPSELSFYSALGVPIIIAPPIGSQEDFNQRWLIKSGFGVNQENIKYINQWFFDWLNQGFLAESAMQGFIEGDKFGTLNIKKLITGL